MFEAILTSLSLVSIVLSASLIIFLYKFKGGLPDFQQVFDEFGESVGGAFESFAKDPMVKRSMAVLGKESGVVRASDALKNKVANKAIGQNLLLKKALEYLDISPMEGLELLNDPTIGPTIRGLMSTFQGGAQGLLSGIGGGGKPGTRPQRNNGNQVPNMS